MKENNSIFAICLFLIYLGIMPLIYAQDTGEVEIDILYTNGDIADYSGIEFVVYQDEKNDVFLRHSATNNPTKLQLPLNHDYKIEIYSNDMFSSFTFLNLDSQKKDIDMEIPLTGGLQVQVLYEDKQTPVSDATVSIKSHKGTEWRRAQTNDDGKTLRFWIQSTNSQDNYYQADVYFADKLVTTLDRIKLQPGISTNTKIIIPVPKIVDDLITVSLYKESAKVTKNDGNYIVILHDQLGNQMQSKVNFRGDAHFSLLKPTKYSIIVESPVHEQTLWPEKNVYIMGKQNQFNIFMNTEITKELVESSEEKPSCNCVAFRLDDVQDFWLNDVQIGIVKTFVSSDLPLTIGIIADSFGSDPKTTNFIKSNKNSLEIASHGFGTTPFTEYDKQTQNQLVKQSVNEIRDKLGVTPRVFIPPQNRINQDTLDVLIENSFTHVSGSILHGSAPPFSLSDQVLYRFPEVATTGQFDPDKNIFVGMSSNQTITETIQGITNFGFAVITMHPQEFSVVEDDVYTNKINQNQLAELEQIISQLQNKGYDIVYLDKINLDSDIQIPKWLKNNARWWAENKIDDNTFVLGLQYLIKQEIITVTHDHPAEHNTEDIPVWIKNNARWWAEGSISDLEFVKGIEFLIENGIIVY